MGGIFFKRSFLWGKNFFWEKHLWGGYSKRETNDQIMLKWGRSFILKNAFSNNLNNVNLVYFED